MRWRRPSCPRRHRTAPALDIDHPRTIAIHSPRSSDPSHQATQSKHWDQTISQQFHCPLPLGSPSKNLLRIIFLLQVEYPVTDRALIAVSQLIFQCSSRVCNRHINLVLVLNFVLTLHLLNGYYTSSSHDHAEAQRSTSHSSQELLIPLTADQAERSLDPSLHVVDVSSHWKLA